MGSSFYVLSCDICGLAQPADWDRLSLVANLTLSSRPKDRLEQVKALLRSIGLGQVSEYRLLGSRRHVRKYRLMAATADTMQLLEQLGGRIVV